MKVTSYSVSKQLHEAGFRSKDVFDYCYKKGEEDGVWNRAFEVSCWENEDLDNYYPAFDLETILEALPKIMEKFPLKLITSQIGDDYIGYCGNDLFNYSYGNIRKKNESIPDTAARLLLALMERGLVKFEESPQEKALKKPFKASKKILMFSTD